MNSITITVEELKAVREEFDCGLIEGKRIAIRRKAFEQLETATTVEELKPIIHLLLEGYRTFN
jgi:hypothetical protein